MNSLRNLLAEESFQHSNSTKTNKQLNPEDDDEQQIPEFICHDLKSINHSTHKPLNRKGSSVFSPERFSPASDSGETAIDAAAVKALVSILSGYIGRYKKDPTFRRVIRNKCKDCFLIRKGKDLDDFDDGIFANFELGIESIERLIEDSGSKQELRVKSLRNTIQLLSIVAELNSKKSKKGSTCGVPNSNISACVQLYLSIVYKLEKNDRIAARHLLQVFNDSPFLARTHLLPDLWEHLFLPHLLHLKIWHHKEVECLSSSISVLNLKQFDCEKRFSALNKAYNGSLDYGTVQFALYYKEWLKIGGKAPAIPHVPLPSKPVFSPSRRISSDSYTSHSSIDRRNLYLAVFGSTPENHPVDFDKLKRDVWIQEDEFKSGSYAKDDLRKSRRRSSTQDYSSSRKGSPSQRRKSSDYLGLFSCQSVVSECLVKGKVVRSNSTRHIPNSDLPSNDLSRAIRTISSSDSITDCEIAIRIITKSWIDSHGNPLVENALSKAPVLEGILEVLFASEDDEILELGISILTEFMARNESTRLIILNADPNLEIFERLLKSSSLFLKAAVLLYLLKPNAKQMISIEWVTLSLRVLEFGDKLQTLFTVRIMPRKAAMYFLDQLLTGFSKDQNLENASQVVSLGGLVFLLRVSEKGHIEERNSAVKLMCCCVRANGNSRNYLADNVNKASILELIALGIQKKSNCFGFAFLAELLCLDRRTRITDFLIELNQGWSGLNTMHIFLVYLQRAQPEERPIVASVLLQLDLLGDPLKSSLYREDAVEAIIESLDSGISNLRIQEELARALLMLGGQFSHSNEEEKAIKDWRRKAAIVLLNYGGKRFLDALSNAIANGFPDLVQACLFTVSWMNRVLNSADDESFRPSARRPLLEEQPKSFDLERNLIKSEECMTMLTTLDKEVLDPLRNCTCDPHNGRTGLLYR